MRCVTVQRRGARPQPLRCEPTRLLASTGVAQQRAGATRQARAARVGRTQHRREERALRALKSRRPLAEKRARRGVDALQLPAETRQIEPSLEYLGLRPDPLHGKRLAYLAPLLHRTAPT